mmetsp:Transcript_11235/g.11189  ORF Transcript_11235/g.11189 Transcript_11235/m.11189 type:complete len:83 (-) Transcript_11235:19-267(-)
MLAKAKEAAKTQELNPSKPLFGKDGGFLKGILAGPGGEKMAQKFGYENTNENHLKFINEIQEKFGNDDQFVAAKKDIIDMLQ